MYSVLKRNGKIEEFDISKIKKDLRKAFKSCKKKFHPDIIDLLTLKVSADFEPKIKEDTISVEEIKDSVESVLISTGYEEVAKSYIIDRKQKENARNASETLLDYKKTVDDYLKVNDWRVKENSTVTYSVGGLILSNSGAMTANYWLSEVYDKEIAKAHKNADIHIHDLSMLTPYCFTGETKIKTLDGKNHSFKELVDNNVKELWVYAYDTQNDKIVIAKAINPRITRKTNTLIEITLTDKSKIQCTPDHLFLTRKGEYIQAKDLKANTSLMPLYIGEKSKYVQISRPWNNTGEHCYVHRWVSEQILGRPLLKTEVPHHINGDKHDNTPENLEILDDSEHRRREFAKTKNTSQFIENNKKGITAYNKSEEKRLSMSACAQSRKRNNYGQFISFSYQPEQDSDKSCYNHCVRAVKTINLDEPIYMYDLTVPKYENFALDAGVFVHNCGGWSLKQLIQEGLGGVPGKITSSPASHLSTLCNQMVNFLGILQNEWAGAQAFSSFDTYLAPFIKADNLSYKEVKQCIQSFIYGVNTPSRWGCVTEDTEVLTVDGFKKYNELKKGDFIYTWKDGLLEVNPVKEIVIKPYKGKIHKYIGNGYIQAVSPEHRVLTVSKEHPEGQIVISEYLNDISNLFVPVNFELSTAYTLAFTRDLKDCNVIIDNDEVLIDVSNFDKKKIDKLQHLILAKGRTSYISDNYIKFSIKSSKKINKKEEVDYDGIVWCPNVENGTAVFRKDGCVYISGQCQAPFTNITLDWTVPNDLAELNCIVGGKEMDFKYKDCKKEMDMVNKAFIEVMLEGDANGRGFQYPIPTYSITRDFDWSETENNKLLFEMTAKYGTPYFSNYVNSDMEPSDIRSMCCRLRLDLRELRKKSGGFFGSGESTGSIGVVTLNLPKLAYLSENESEFYSKLDELMDIAARSLHIKRTVVSNLLEAGLYPYTKRYLGSFNNHFSTIGLVGMNEVGLNAKWLKADMTNPKTQQFAKDVLNHMRERLSDYQELYEGELFNLEATPAESTVYRFAKHDRAKYPDIITAGEPGATPYYTNSSHLPVGYTDDIFSALDIQDELQTLYTSGTVFHGFLGEKLPSWQSAMVLVRKIAENYKLPYYTLSPTYSVCKNHGYIAGEVYECPDCGEKTEVYSRITGYYRPVQNWNDGKSQEFKDRKIYKNPIKEETTTAFDSALAGSKIFLKEQGFISDSGEPKLSSCTVAPIGIKHILIATKTCPNCKIAASLLDKAGIKYEKVLAEENPEIPTKLGIKQAPTLVVYYNDEPTLYSGVSNIKKYINS